MIRRLPHKVPSIELAQQEAAVSQFGEFAFAESGSKSRLFRLEVQKGPSEAEKAALAAEDIYNLANWYSA